MAGPGWVRAATYSPGSDPSTIGAAGLNFSVRDGKRWGPCAGPPNVFSIKYKVSSIWYPGTKSCVLNLISYVYFEVFRRECNGLSCVQVFGQLVPLGFAVAGFTPAAYRPRDLRGPSWKSNLGVGFALRCFQRLSLPDVATRRCSWHHSRHTSGRSSPVLSY